MPRPAPSALGQYHLGTSYNRPTINGKMVHLSLMANPSHLEAVNTAVLGKTRAKQLIAVRARGRACERWRMAPAPLARRQPGSPAATRGRMEACRAAAQRHSRMAAWQPLPGPLLALPCAPMRPHAPPERL